MRETCRCDIRNIKDLLFCKSKNFQYFADLSVPSVLNKHKTPYINPECLPCWTDLKHHFRTWKFPHLQFFLLISFVFSVFLPPPFCSNFILFYFELLMFGCLSVYREREMFACPTKTQFDLSLELLNKALGRGGLEIPETRLPNRDTN